MGLDNWADLFRRSPFRGTPPYVLLRAARRIFVQARFGSGYEPERMATYLGKPFSYPADSIIGAEVGAGNEWDRVLRTVAQELLPEREPVVCDVGTNLGASLLQILAARPQARVRAFEPSN